VQSISREVADEATPQRLHAELLFLTKKLKLIFLEHYTTEHSAVIKDFVFSKLVQIGLEFYKGFSKT